MATLTSDQLADIRVDLDADSSVFTDAELNRLYTRADADYDTAVVYAIDQLLMSASKLTRYTQNQSSEDKTAVFKQLQQIRKLWADKAGLVGGKLTIGSLDLDINEDDPSA